MATPGKTPVSVLQELMAAKKLSLPTYCEEDAIIGYQFKCTVHAGGVTAIGFGTTKKAAKQESAKNALAKFGTPPRLTVVQEPQKNYVGDLNEYASKKRLPYPSYNSYNTVQSTTPEICSCTFWGKQSLGRGATKKEAKQDAAKNMLKLVNAQEAANASKVTVTIIQDGADIDKLTSMYEKLTTHSINLQNPNTFAEDTVDMLMVKLRAQGVDFTIKDIQSDPYVLSLTVKDTNYIFVENGETREETLRKLLQKVILLTKNGVSLTPDLISL